MLFICSIYLATTLHLIHDQTFLFCEGVAARISTSLWQLKEGMGVCPPPLPPPPTNPSPELLLFFPHFLSNPYFSPFFSLTLT